MTRACAGERREPPKARKLPVARRGVRTIGVDPTGLSSSRSTTRRCRGCACDRTLRRGRHRDDGEAKEEENGENGARMTYSLLNVVNERDR